MVNLNSKILAALQVQCAPPDEQQQFEAQVSDARQRISAEKDALDKLRILKLGLVDDLLTGRVRVTLPAGATP